MSMSLIGASSQFIQQLAPVTIGFPFSVGMWFRPTNTESNTFWSIGATANAAAFRMTSNTTNFDFVTSDGTTTQSAGVTGGVTVGEWHYVVCRGISTTNRKTALLKQNGTLLFGAGSIAGTTEAWVKMTVGALSASATSNHFDGQLAEFFYADADIQPGGLAMEDWLIRQLAFRGPLSVPSIATNIVEYRSFRDQSSFATSGESSREVYQRSGFRPWTSNGGPTIGEHPPIYQDYVRPMQSRAVMLV